MQASASEWERIAPSSVFFEDFRYFLDFVLTQNLFYSTLYGETNEHKA